MPIPDPILAAIASATGSPAVLSRRSPVGGGCINNSEILQLADGRRFFVKSNASAPPAMFEREADGLAALAAPGAIRVPAVVATGGGAESIPPFLILECISPGKRGPGFFADFGRRLALHHRQSQSRRFGFDRDNFIGSTPQPNGWMDDWVAFFRERRLAHQLELARMAGLADAAMLRAGARLLDRLDSLIADPAEPACTLHGDLWGGNYLCDEHGAPVLIDPAVYCGRREADLAMTYLFGGFDGAFYAAYQELWPLAGGWPDRMEIYKLYHLLNHLNLFGSGYYAQCMSILKRFA